MKLGMLGISLVYATLSFGQSSLQIQSPSGRVWLSANSITGVVDSTTVENGLNSEQQLKLIELRQSLAQMSAIYTAEHYKVREVQSQIDVLERFAKLRASSITSRSDKGIIQLKGNVEIKTETMSLTADEADYVTATGEIAPHGTVRVKLISK